MPHEDKELGALLSRWQESPPAGLAARIAANATALPQRKPWSLRGWVGDWNHAMAYQGMALAACAVIGIYMGQTGPAEDIDISSFVMASPSLPEEL